MRRTQTESMHRNNRNTAATCQVSLITDQSIASAVAGQSHYRPPTQSQTQNNVSSTIPGSESREGISNDGPPPMERPERRPACDARKLVLLCWREYAHLHMDRRS